MLLCQLKIVEYTFKYKLHFVSKHMYGGDKKERKWNIELLSQDWGMASLHFAFLDFQMFYRTHINNQKGAVRASSEQRRSLGPTPSFFHLSGYNQTPKGQTPKGQLRHPTELWDLYKHGWLSVWGLAYDHPSLILHPLGLNKSRHRSWTLHSQVFPSWINYLSWNLVSWFVDCN